MSAKYTREGGANPFSAIVYMTSDLYEHAYASSSSLLGYMFDNKCQTQVDCPINEKANLSPTFVAKIHIFSK